MILFGAEVIGRHTRHGRAISPLGASRDEYADDLDACPANGALIFTMSLCHAC